MSSLASARGSMLHEGAGLRAPPTRDDTVVIAGWSVPRPGVTKLVGELRSFQQHFERVFVALAEGLPSVSSGVQALTAPFAALRDPKRGFAGQLHQHLNFIVDQGHAAIEAVLAHNEAGLESATALGELAAVLRARLASSLALSHSLRLAGLNARFAVSRLGQQGATFDAVTRELIDLADGAVQLAQTMGATARQTGEVATRLGVAQQAATGPMRAAMAEAETGRQRVSAECDAVLDVVDAELAELNAHGQAVAAATGAVMEAIQRQDIIRQGLDHVIVVLGALDDEFEQLAQGPRQTQALMGFSCIQRDASRLIADLLTDVGQQLTALLGLLERPVSGVSAAAGAIAERGVDLGELAGRLGGAPDAVVNGLTTLAKHEVGFGECERQMGEFEALLRALRPALNQLDKLPLEIDVISVLLSIEIARMDALAGAARVTDELGAAGARFSALGVAAGEEGGRGGRAGGFAQGCHETAARCVGQPAHLAKNARGRRGKYPRSRRLLQPRPEGAGGGRPRAAPARCRPAARPGRVRPGARGDRPGTRRVCAVDRRGRYPLRTARSRRRPAG
jgi:hypothetical protein